MELYTTELIEKISTIIEKQSCQLINFTVDKLTDDIVRVVLEIRKDK